MKKLSDNSRYILITAIILIGLVAADFFCGYYFGKKSIESKITKKETEISWVKGKTIRDTIFQPKPYETIKNDTVSQIIYELIHDTIRIAEVIEDYYAEKKYNLDFSTDTTGVFKVDVGIRENNLIYANSEITPLIKTITETNYIQQRKKVGFFIAAGTSLKFNTQKLEFGVLIKDRFLIGLTGIRLKKEFNYTLDFGVKF